VKKENTALAYYENSFDFMDLPENVSQDSKESQKTL
jgi:hypothetical protein